ncbi:hypothetical protein NFJ02_06g128010 [Pycnococcus provasolii]
MPPRWQLCVTWDFEIYLRTTGDHGRRCCFAIRADRQAVHLPSHVVYGASQTRKAEFLRGPERWGISIAFVGDGV